MPDFNDFTAGMAVLLKPGGLISIEVAHLASLIEHNEFDTIYHEHFMYYTVRSARSVLAMHGLRVVDVELLPTHGGSLRLWAVHDDDARPTSPSVEHVLAAEAALGLDHLEGYAGFAERVATIKRDLLDFLIAERRRGSLVVGYGAPGKGNTLLNYCGIRTDLLAFVVDRNPYKWGRFTPGTHIPILPTERLVESNPDVVLIMAWNLRDEITAQLRDMLPVGTRLAVAIPALDVVRIDDVSTVERRSTPAFEDSPAAGVPA